MKLLTVALIVVFFPVPILAANTDGLSAICAAYLVNLTLHEIGHQAAATDTGADGSRMRFFTSLDGQFFPGLSTYDHIPDHGRLPYAAGGFRMSNHAFDYGLSEYRTRPTTFNKALMVISAVDFLLYTAYANFCKPDDPWLDPNQISQHSGISKDALLGLAALNSLMQYCRIKYKSNLCPSIETSRDSVFFMVRIQF